MAWMTLYLDAQTTRPVWPTPPTFIQISAKFHNYECLQQLEYFILLHSSLSPVFFTLTGYRIHNMLYSNAQQLTAVRVFYP